MLTTSFTKGFCTFTDRVFNSPSVPTDNFDLPMDNWFTIGTDRTDGQGFWGLPYALAIMLTTSFTKGFCTFTDRLFISPSVPTDNFDLPMDNWFTIGTDRTDGQGFWGLPYALAIMLTTSFTKGFCTFTDRVFISPSVPTDNFDLPMENWFTIGTDRTDGQGFWGATLCPCNNANYLIHERILHIYRSVFISPSVPTDNFDLPMVNWFTIGTDRTDGQGFWGLPYALAIMLTTSFTKGFCTFTDRLFISPSVPTDNFDLPMENWFTIGTDRTDGQGFWGATLCPCNNANYLIHERILHIYRSSIHFSIRTDGQLRFTDGQLVYHRYRPYRWTRFLGATLCPCNNANYLIHERILHIYRSCIHFSIRIDGQLRFTDGQLVYHRNRPYRWTRFLGATLCPCNNANYLIHERILHIYRSSIHFSIRTDGQLRFTDGQLVYHRYRPYRWTRFLGATLCPCNNANYLIHERILHIYRSCIHFSIRTDGQLRFTDGKLVYHRYRPYRWTRFLGLPYALAIMLTTSFTKGFCTFTDRVFISPSVPTDNFDLPMGNWFTFGTDRTDGQGFWGATLCPCNNANYLIHERILHIYRSCIHFSIRTDGHGW